MFRKLRGKLKEMDIDQAYLGKQLGLTRVCISNRMTGKVAWCLNEMYALMELIQEPVERLHEYFPKDGVDISVTKAPQTRYIRRIISR
jgi:hypothetical protein